MKYVFGPVPSRQRINRPHPQSTFERLVDGMISFRKQYNGHFWLEVMLVSRLNDSNTALKDFSAAIERIQPDEVHINIPDRPPSESWVYPPDEDAIARAQSILGRSTKVLHPAANTFTPTHRDEIADTILDIITRHPLREGDLIRAMSEFPENQLHEILNELIAAGKARTVERYGHRFLAAGPARFQE